MSRAVDPCPLAARHFLYAGDIRAVAYRQARLIWYTCFGGLINGDSVNAVHKNHLRHRLYRELSPGAIGGPLRPIPRWHPMSTYSQPAQNKLLARLPPAEYQRQVGHMRLVPLEFKQILYKCGQPMTIAYFPTRGAVSAISIMEDGDAIEVATIGNEGVVGHNVLLGDGTAPTDMIVQVAGEALQINVDTLKHETEKDGSLRGLLQRYTLAFMTQVSQSVACNGLHPIQQRCCRWLLITLDRMESNVVPLTHEFLAIMLGVRRASVTEVLGPLQEKGLVSSKRGMITILDRAGLEKLSCECYRKVKVDFDRLLG
jgi:CRP-like cAMP-binding protein